MRFTLKGTRTASEKTVLLNGERLTPDKSQAVINHSPDGFEWGYGGSGPAQLALAVLLELHDKETACKNYQKFKHEFIANIGRADFDLRIDYHINWKQEIILDDVAGVIVHTAKHLVNNP